MVNTCKRNCLKMCTENRGDRIVYQRETCVHCNSYFEATFIIPDQWGFISNPVDELRNKDSDFFE